MSNLLKKYEESNIDRVVRARQQSEGQQEVNYVDVQNTYQEQFDARIPGDKQVLQSTGEDDTAGSWKDRSLNFYQELVGNPRLTTTRGGRLIHTYNARDRSTHYTEINNNALGTIYGFPTSE